MQQILLDESNDRLALYWLRIFEERLIRLKKKIFQTEVTSRKVITNEEHTGYLELEPLKPFITESRFLESQTIESSLAKVHTKCPFRYRQHCAFIEMENINQKDLQEYHLKGMESHCPNTASYIYALSNRRTRLERLQLQFKWSKPMKLSFTVFMYPTEKKISSFKISPADLSIFGDYRHGCAVKFGRHGKHPNLVNMYAHIVGVKNQKIWVTIKGTELALPVYVPGCRCLPEDVTTEYDLWSIEGKIHLRNHSVPVVEEVWGTPGVVSKKTEKPKISAMDRVKKKIGIVSKFGFGFVKDEKKKFDPLIDFHKQIDKSIATQCNGLIPIPPTEEPDIFMSDDEPDDKNSTALSFNHY